MRRAAAFATTLALSLLAVPFTEAAESKDNPEKGFTSLFNGKDLTGWTKAKENEDTFSVKEGAIVANGPRCHLYYTGPFGNHDFKNFELRVDVMTLPVSNGGVYFHTAYQEKGWPAKGFEMQVNNTHGDWRRTASLYEVEDVREQLAPDGKWFTERVVVEGKHVVIYVDDKKAVDWTEPDDWKGTKDFVERRIDHGTIALQGHDPKSTVYYKNIRIKLLK